MGQNCHRKISTGCIILIAICTIGLNAILTEATSTATTTTTTEKEDSDDLQKAETKDGKVEIIKQIQKVNNDGSYTVGYEAEDGTFKIESRDVLGNVKGTFGYIDLNGEIKRVSYTANNGTGLKNIPETSEEVDEESKYNKTERSSSGTRRSVYSSTSAPSVIQAIPRRLRVLSSSHSAISSTERPYREHASTSKAREPTTTVVYATSVPTKPYINIRPTPLPGTNLRHQGSEQQISRPEKLEIKHHTSQVQHSSNRELSTTKPVVEDVDEKDEEKIILRGNSLRRQLNTDNEGRETVSGVVRPIYSTTNSPKLPSLVLAARQRATQIQNNLNSHSAISGKYYAKPPTKKTDDPTTESTSEYAYLTQPSPVQNQIPANTDQENRVLRKSEYRTAPQFIRVHPGRTNTPQFVRIPLPQSSTESEQYLRETTPIPTKPETAEQDPVPAQAQGYQRNPPQQPAPPPPGYYYPQQQNQMSAYYPQPSPAPYPYGNAPAPYYNSGGYPGERPLTTRDFERLLHLLVLRHQYLQRISNPYLGGYDPYYNGYQPNYPRPLPIYNPYDPRQQYRGPPYPDENMYQAQSPIPQSAAESPPGYELQRLVPRKKQFNPQYFGAQLPGYGPVDEYGSHTQIPPGQANYLPPDVREELLYRMLMLALQSEPQKTIVPAEAESTTKPSTVSYNRKPVRSVQILGEEE